MRIESVVSNIQRTRAPQHRHVFRGRTNAPLVWVAQITDRKNYYGKNCCPAYQPPRGSPAGIRQKYNWKALHLNMTSDTPWLQPPLRVDGQFCAVEDQWPSSVTIDTSHPEVPGADAESFYALNQTDFYYHPDIEGSPTGLRRIDVGGGGNGRNVRFTFMSVGYIDPNIRRGCDEEPRQKRWQPFFNHYFFPFSSPCQ